MQISAELRWFWEDRCPERVFAWFQDRSPNPFGEAEVRVDLYYHRSGNTQIGCKLRDAQAKSSDIVELKALIARTDEDSIELWAKWIWQPPIGVLGVPVRKERWLQSCIAPVRRRTHQFVRHVERDSKSSSRTDATERQIELTRVSVGQVERAWWTLGFEVSGTVDSARAGLSEMLQTDLPPMEGALRLNYPEFLEMLTSKHLRRQ
ncbi:hypothetical protein [Novosphingobium sp. PY1]|uniref:hypothetical protein n=1 Tax=Novosphingobium sp. PY1 TaxID=1882221 RepID=UPI001A8F752F|nr:hypothetical protein [Novosphingobium sp. PY1]GFM30721.1 conjugative transposon TraM protein [Novosphingobium sp. PY1]